MAGIEAALAPEGIIIRSELAHKLLYSDDSQTKASAWLLTDLYIKFDKRRAEFPLAERIKLLQDELDRYNTQHLSRYKISFSFKTSPYKPDNTATPRPLSSDWVQIQERAIFGLESWSCRVEATATRQEKEEWVARTQGQLEDLDPEENLSHWRKRHLQLTEEGCVVSDGLLVGCKLEAG